MESEREKQRHEWLNAQEESFMSGGRYDDQVKVGSEILRFIVEWAIQETQHRVPRLPFATSETFQQERVNCVVITEEDG
jgi:hypothetical protein